MLLALLPVLVLRQLFFPATPTPATAPRDKHVVVTGGSSGIGKAVAAEFLQRGARVTLLARNVTKLEMAVDELKPISDAVGFVSVDVAEGHQAVSKALKEATEAPVDILVCSAGVSYPGVFEDITAEEWKQLNSINVMGCVNSINAVLPEMKQRQCGQIVLVSSMAGQVGIYGFGAYSASKFALRGMAEALRMECKPYGISVSLAFPPDTDTPMLAAEQAAKPLECKKISEGAGLSTPEEVARSIADGMCAEKFFVSQGLDGFMLAHLTAGMVPSHNLVDFALGVMLAPLFRVIALAHSVPWDRMVLAEHLKKVAKNGLISNGD